MKICGTDIPSFFSWLILNRDWGGGPLLKKKVEPSPPSYADV